IELEDFYEFHQTAIRDIQLAVEIKAARVAVSAVFGNLAIVDVAREFGGVLIFFILGLEGADSDTVLFRQDETIDLNFLEHAIPVAVIFRQSFVEHLAAEGTQITFDGDVMRGVSMRLVEPGENAGPEVQRN